MGTLTYQSVLIVLIGAAVFILGTANLRRCFREKGAKGKFSGKVLSVKLTEKRDEEKRLIQHYYDVTVQYREGKKVCNQTIKTTREYVKGDTIALIKNGNQASVFKQASVSASMAFMITLAGMFLAVFPVVYQNEGEVKGSVALILFLIMVGGIAFSAYVRDCKRKLVQIEGIIEDVLYYTKGKKKRLTRPMESYYPLIRYRAGDKERVFLGSYNSNQKTVFKSGKAIKLYYDEELDMPVEKKASPVLVATAGLLWALALVGIISLFSL